MPFVNIKITEGATAKQKEELIKGVTDLLSDVLGKSPNSIMVAIEELSADNFGFKGETVTNLRKKQ